ncbi:ATP-binding cassette domain-containing protein, partial [bacterium]|nr:ATP-binding cassette domain-containing protein [bacterium]
FLASIFINIFAVLGSLFSMNVYDRVVPNGAIETLYTLASGMILMHLFDFMLKVVRGYFLDVINKKTDIRLTSMIFDHLLHIQMLAKPKSVGSFSSMIGQFESFRDFFTSASMATLIDIPFVLFFIGVIWFLSGPLVLAVVLAIPFIVIATLVTQYMCYERVKLSMRLSSQKNALLIEYLGSLEAIKFWGAQSQLQQRWDAIIAESARVHTEIKTIQSLSSNFCQVVQSLSYVGMICYGVTLIIAHQLTMGALIGASILSSKALTPILQVGQLMLRWQHAKSSLEGMDQLMKMPLETQENALSVYDMKGHFQFSKVKFTYAEGSLPTLVDIDLEIKAGDRIGIVGANGSGKSTLIKMLLGLYRATEGNLLLDGMDIKQFNMTSLRRAIGYVPQDIHLVHGTLRENITMGCEYVTQQALLRATHDAGLMDFIGQHPKGLDMMIGERGETLSGGQRQAIALARALLNDPKILILDEPTSALDFQAESQFIENVQRILIDKTLIIVSHRQAPLRLCQELIVMHQGRIVKRQPLQFEVAKGAS